MDQLTDRQARLFAYLCDHQAKLGLAPSIPDICAHFGYASPRAAAKLLEKLSEKGFIAREPGARRAIRILERPAFDPGRQLPLIGRIGAGMPITSGEHVAEYLDVASHVFRPRADLLFRVRGESMVNAGIHDGDIVGVHQQEISNGQIVAAVVIDPVTDDPQLTLKRFHRRGTTIRLLSENDDQVRYAPLVFDTRQDAVQIVGLFCGLIRTGLA